MSLRIGQHILIDTGYLYALFEEKDEHHSEALEYAEFLSDYEVIIPWPILYETVNTRFIRRPLTIRRMEGLLKRPNITLLDDRAYKQEALDLSLSNVGRAFSVVDNVLRLVLDDRTVRVNYLFSFNRGDFADVCVRGGMLRSCPRFRAANRVDQTAPRFN